MLAEHQAGHASLALKGLKRTSFLWCTDTLSMTESVALQESVRTIVQTHPQHTPIQEAGKLTILALAKSLVCGPPPDDVKETVKAEEMAALTGSMYQLSITQLKRLIESRGASHADCLERSELEARALQACQPAAE